LTIPGSPKCRRRAFTSATPPQQLTSVSSQQLRKRLLSQSPADAISAKRILAASPSPSTPITLDPRDSEIKLLREFNTSLQAQLAALQATISTMSTQQSALIAEVKALRLHFGDPGIVNSLTGPQSQLNAGTSTSAATPAVQPIPLDLADFPPLNPSPILKKGKGKEKELPSTVPVSDGVEVTTTLETSQHATPAPERRPRMSYRDAAISVGLVGSDLEDARKALAKLSRRPAQVGKDGCKLVKVYVRGIGRMPIRDVRKCLKDLRFQTSRILNVSFLGTMTVEFCITGDYIRGFQKRIETLGASAGWKVLSAFDAASVADPQADETTKKRVQAAFVQRIHGIIQSTSRPAVKAHYETWLQSLNLPLPTPPQQPVQPVTPSLEVPSQAQGQADMMLDQQPDPSSVPGELQTDNIEH